MALPFAADWMAALFFSNRIGALRAGILPSTSRVEAGAVVPMPTLVSAVAPFTPLMLPSTSVLLAVTSALAPMAVVFVRVPVEGPALNPSPVLLLPVVLATRAARPSAVF